MCYRHEAELAHSVLAPSDARAVVRRTCHELHVEDVADTAALLTSELVTNALVHGDGPVRLGVACTQGRLVVSVIDRDPRPPRPRRPQARELGGRGLMLVTKLAERWGYRQLPNDGKAVWFSLRPHRPPIPGRACRCRGETLEAALAAEPSTVIDLLDRIPASRDGR